MPKKLWPGTERTTGSLTDRKGREKPWRFLRTDFKKCLSWLVRALKTWSKSSAGPALCGRLEHVLSQNLLHSSSLSGALALLYPEPCHPPRCLLKTDKWPSEDRINVPLLP